MYDYCLLQHNLQDSKRTKEIINRSGVVTIVQFGVHGVSDDGDVISTYSNT
jgi:hypothetical protein